MTSFVPNTKARNERYLIPDTERALVREQYTEVQKTQAGRLRSIFLISPILVIAALMPSTPMWMRILLFVIGISTIVVVGYSVIKTNEANRL